MNYLKNKFVVTFIINIIILNKKYALKNFVFKKKKDPMYISKTIKYLLVKMYEYLKIKKKNNGT